MRAVPLSEQAPRQASGGAPIAPVFEAGNTRATEEAAFVGCRIPGFESPERMDELGMWIKGRGVALCIRGALVRVLMGRQVSGGLPKVGWEMLTPAS